MKIRTTERLNELILDDLAWRKQEIAAFDGQVARSKGIARTALLRASAALLYAHWEGFVKHSSYLYANYLATLRLPQNGVRNEIVAFGLRSHFKRMESAKRITDFVTFVEEFRAAELSRLRIMGDKEAIDTQSNLSSRVLEDLLNTFGISYAPYVPDADLIDLNLLVLRNAIAHGELVELAEPEWSDLRRGVVSLLDRVAGDVLDHAVQRRYLSGAA
jgi:hypothetical protein